VKRFTSAVFSLLNASHTQLVEICDDWMIVPLPKIK